MAMAPTKLCIMMVAMCIVASYGGVLGQRAPPPARSRSAYQPPCTCAPPPGPTRTVPVLPEDAQAALPEGEYDTFHRFWLHVDMTGARFTAVQPVAQNNFGQTIMFDGKIAYEADPDRAVEVGRARGTITMCDIQQQAGHNVYTAQFYNDSESVTGWGSLNFMGYELYTDTPQTAQYSIIGGTGRFRCARGVVLESTEYSSEDLLVVREDCYMNIGCQR